MPGGGIMGGGAPGLMPGGGMPGGIMPGGGRMPGGGITPGGGIPGRIIPGGGMPPAEHRPMTMVSEHASKRCKCHSFDIGLAARRGNSLACGKPTECAPQQGIDASYIVKCY